MSHFIPEIDFTVSGCSCPVEWGTFRPWFRPVSTDLLGNIVPPPVLAKARRSRAISMVAEGRLP